METPKIFESEYRFCLILWEHEPVNSTQLVHLCQQRLQHGQKQKQHPCRRTNSQHHCLFPGISLQHLAQQHSGQAQGSNSKQRIHHSPNTVLMVSNSSAIS